MANASLWMEHHPLLVAAAYTLVVLVVAFYVGWREQLRLDDELWQLRRLPPAARDWAWPECEKEVA